MIDPDRELWRAVILQALEDVCRGSKLERARVVAWAMAVPGCDFQEVCDMADIDASRTREAITMLFNMQDHYRKYYYGRLSTWLRNLEREDRSLSQAPDSDPHRPSSAPTGGVTERIVPIYAYSQRRASAENPVPSPGAAQPEESPRPKRGRPPRDKRAPNQGAALYAFGLLPGCKSHA